MTFFRAHPAAHVAGTDVYAPPELNAWDLNIARAVDGAAGGRCSPSAPIIIGGAGLILTAATKLGATSAPDSLRTTGYPVRLSYGGELPDADNLTLDPAAGIIRRFRDPTALRNHDLVAAGNVGSLLWLSTYVTNVWQIIVHRTGFVGAYVVMLQAGYSSALLYDDGTNWRLLYGLNVAPGVDA